MSDIDLSANGQTTQHKPSVALYWDCQNVRASLHQAKCLLDFASDQGLLVIKKAYAYWRLENKSFEESLYNLDVDCINIASSTKNSLDNKLIAQCRSEVLNNPDIKIVIILSGDGDFAPLVQELKAKGKKVIIIAQRGKGKQRGNVNEKLKQLADEFYLVDELPKLVEDKPETKTISIQSKITYEDAIECLLEAIKIALSQGKKTALGYINKLMCNSHSFPNYQGFSSILKPDGKTFSQFGKFVDAVVKDGKIRKQEQELFLV